MKRSKLKDLQAEVQKEPRIALDGGIDGLSCYLSIFPILKKCLKKDGFAIYRRYPRYIGYLTISSLPIRPVKESPALSFFNLLIIILLRILVNQDNTQKQRIYTLSTLLRLRNIRINYLVTILILHSIVQH